MNEYLNGGDGVKFRLQWFAVFADGFLNDCCMDGFSLEGLHVGRRSFPGRQPVGMIYIWGRQHKGVIQ
jgi:hypothetical protein